MAGGFRLVRTQSLPEGVYIKVRAGRIIDHETFDTAHMNYRKPNYNAPSRYERTNDDWRTYVPTDIDAEWFDKYYADKEARRG